MACSPEPQSRFTDSAGASFGMPDFRPMWRAKYTASPDVWRTFPKMTWSICFGSTFDFSSAPLAAMTPRSVAEVSRSAPPYVPKAVRAPSMMTMSFIGWLPSGAYAARIHCPTTRAEGRTTHRPPFVDYSAASTGQRSCAELGNERLTVFPVGPTTTVAAPLVNQKPGRSGRKIVDRPASVTVVEPSAFAVMNAGPEMFT